MLERFFHLKERGTTAGTELRGAFATFLTMAYIIFVNPDILSHAGVPKASAVACTAAAAGLCCILMGFASNFPMALASGMGLNAFVASIALDQKSWHIGMGLIVLDGIVVLALVLCGLREAVLNAIPRDLRRAIGAGIGLFIAFVGAVNARFVVVPKDTLFVLGQAPGAVMPPVGFGGLRSPEAAVAMVGLLITAFLMARRVKGAIVLGILLTTAVAFSFGIAEAPKGFHAPSFEAAFHADVMGALKWSFMPLLMAIVMVDFFDTIGTVTGIAEQANLQDERGRIPGIRAILVVDSLAASIGGLFGASSVTCYVESAAGVSEGARTGLSSVFVGLMFLVCIFAAPVAGIVPGAATAPALIVVGFLMAGQIARIDFTKYDTAIPAFVTLVTLPFTYSISHGIGFGFITYVAIKVLSLRLREVHPLMYFIAAAFAAYFIWGKI